MSLVYYEVTADLQTLPLTCEPVSLSFRGTARRASLWEPRTSFLMVLWTWTWGSAGRQEVHTGLSTMPVYLVLSIINFLWLITYMCINKNMCMWERERQRGERAPQIHQEAISWIFLANFSCRKTHGMFMNRRLASTTRWVEREVSCVAGVSNLQVGLQAFQVWWWALSVSVGGCLQSTPRKSSGAAAEGSP